MNIHLNLWFSKQKWKHERRKKVQKAQMKWQNDDGKKYRIPKFIVCKRHQKNNNYDETHVWSVECVCVCGAVEKWKSGLRLFGTCKGYAHWVCVDLTWSDLFCDLWKVSCLCLPLSHIEFSSPEYVRFIFHLPSYLSFFFPPYFTPSAPPFLYFFLLCSPSLLFSQSFSSFISPPLKPPHGLLSIPSIFRILSAFVNQIFCLLPILIADKNKLNDKEPNETERQIKKVISMLEYQTKRLVKSLWKMEFQCSNLHIQAGRICVWLI